MVTAVPNHETTCSGLYLSSSLPENELATSDPTVVGLGSLVKVRHYGPRSSALDEGYTAQGNKDALIYGNSLQGISMAYNPGRVPYPVPYTGSRRGCKSCYPGSLTLKEPLTRG